MIDLRNLTHLGSDYDRKRDVYRKRFTLFSLTDIRAAFH